MKLNYNNNIYDETAISDPSLAHECCEKPSCCEPRKYCKPYDPDLSPCPYPILFEATEGNKVSLPKTNTAIENFSPKTVGSLNLDTRCLKGPFVKIDFSANIILDFSVGIANFITDTFFVSFDLIKTCNGNSTSLGTYEFNYSESLDTNLGTGQYHYEFPFAFTKLESNASPCAATYTVRVTDVSVSGTGPALFFSSTTINTFAVQDSILSAMAKSSR